jgi:hypothetical protein
MNRIRKEEGFTQSRQGGTTRTKEEGRVREFIWDQISSKAESF